ncbi:MAG: hypothetical protein SPF16_06180, partial [Prevotella sp.]|nr:hypothetical protein [Prevotella sp.]
RRRKTKSTDAKPRAESSLLGYAEARRRKTKSTDAKPRAESSLLGYAEARRRKTKSTGVMLGDMSFSQWPGREEEDEVNRRITSGRIGNHNMRDTAKYG